MSRFLDAKSWISLLLAASAFLGCGGRGSVPISELDLLIHSGRAIDPETGLDAIRDVGVHEGRIVWLGPSASLHGDVRVRRELDASGLVIAPGFIDLHAHGQGDRAHDYQARDGVTTALELEWGYPEVGAFLEAKRGRSRIHYGASVSHGALRSWLFASAGEEREHVRERMLAAMSADEPLYKLPLGISGGIDEPFGREGWAELEGEIERGLSEGGLGIGMAHAYYPGASRAEILETFRVAATNDVPIFTHVRGKDLSAIQEVVANAAATGASLHIVHINSSSLGQIEHTLALVRGARARGVDVTTESYPYTAGSTSITAALFDSDWRSEMGIDYCDIQWQDTGERLTTESFARYRAEGGAVIIHHMKEEWIRQPLAADWVIVASDGMPYAPGAHPRSAGTFSRVLGRYVREEGLLDLPTAIRKMTLLPARRLEAFAPQMRRKGRLQVGADADLVIFDAATIADTATFEDGLSYSAGVRHVLVMGEAVVRDGKSVDGVFPGQAIVGEARDD